MNENEQESEKREYTMTGIDKQIFNATRTLTSLLNDACNHWNYLCPYLEKLAGVADDALRGYQKDYPRQVAELIDYRRERAQQGNAAALREAMEGMCKASQDVFRSFARETFAGERRLDSLGVALDKAKAALSAPARNCDVGTAEEQKARMFEYCKSHKNKDGIIICDQCPHHGPNWTWCALRWAQMPYAEEGGAK